MLDGVVDIYLPDFKYSDGAMAATYSSGAASYPEVTQAAQLALVRGAVLERLGEAVRAARGGGPPVKCPWIVGRSDRQRTQRNARVWSRPSAGSCLPAKTWSDSHNRSDDRKGT
jgi:hypothetical protein